MDMQVAALDILTTKGGFASAAARAIGEAMDLQIARSYDDLATNQRLDETRVLLESKIDGFRTELKGDIFRLDAKIDSVRVELNAKIEQLRADLKADMAALESKLMRWMFSALAGQTLVLAGLIRLFMPHGP